MWQRLVLVLAVVLGLAVVLPHRRPWAADNEQVREVEVAPLVLTNLGFTVTLRAREGGGQVEMMVGFLEGESIEMARRKQKAPRPLTHDIFKTFLDRNGWQVERVVVRDLVDGTFVADLVFQKDGQKQTYDARPSDSIALALRSGAKIFVAGKVFEKQQKEEDKQPAQQRRRATIT